MKKISVLIASILMSCMAANAAYREKLDAAGYPYEYMETEGGHIWRNWRIYLDTFLPKLFK